MVVLTGQVYHLGVGNLSDLMRVVLVASVILCVIFAVRYTNDVYHTKRISLEGVDLLQL